MVLSGAIPKYIMPKYNSEWDNAGGINAEQVSLAKLGYAELDIIAACRRKNIPG